MISSVTHHSVWGLRLRRGNVFKSFLSSDFWKSILPMALFWSFFSFIIDSVQVWGQIRILPRWYHSVSQAVIGQNTGKVVISCCSDVTPYDAHTYNWNCQVSRPTIFPLSLFLSGHFTTSPPPPSKSEHSRLLLCFLSLSFVCQEKKTPLPHLSPFVYLFLLFLFFFLQEKSPTQWREMG